MAHKVEYGDIRLDLLTLGDYSGQYASGDAAGGNLSGDVGNSSNSRMGATAEARSIRVRFAGGEVLGKFFN